MSTRNIGAGLAYLHYGVINANGYLIGNDNDGATAGSTTGQGMRRLEGAQVFPAQTPQPESVVVSGDDAPLVSFTFAAEALANGVIGMAARDLTFEAVINNTQRTQTGILDYVGQDSNATDKATMALLVQRRAKSWVSGSRGSDRWEWALILRAEVTALGAEYNSRQASPYNYFYTASKGDSALDGVTFKALSSAQGFTQATVLTGTNSKPLYWHAFKGNNSVTAFTLPFTPETPTSTVVAVNGVRQTYTTDFTVSGATLTFTSAPAANASIVVIFDTDESNL